MAIRKLPPTSMRLSHEALALIALLSRKLGASRTGVLELAVRRLAEAEGFEPLKQSISESDEAQATAIRKRERAETDLAQKVQAARDRAELVATRKVQRAEIDTARKATAAQERAEMAAARKAQRAEIKAKTKLNS